MSVYRGRGKAAASAARNARRRLVRRIARDLSVYHSSRAVHFRWVPFEASPFPHGLEVYAVQVKVPANPNRSAKHDPEVSASFDEARRVLESRRIDIAKWIAAAVEYAAMEARS